MLTASASTTIGACIAIASSILNAIGFTLQKQGHNRIKEHNRDSPVNHDTKKLLSDKTWCIGFAIFIFGGIGNAIALYFAPQSLVLPLSAVTLVANTILATQILAEPFTKKSYAGICLVIIGSTLAVIFGPRTGGEHINITMLKERWGNVGFLVFFICLSALTVLDFIGIKYYERLNVLDPDVQQKEIKHGRTFLLLSYGFMNGYFGSNAFLFLKAFTEFLGASFSSLQDAEAAIQSWYSYFILFCVVLSNTLFVMWQQRGLSFFASVYVIPINQVTLIVMGSVLGGVYFDEFADLSTLYGAMFLFSILVTLLGVIVLAAGHQSTHFDFNKKLLTMYADNSNHELLQRNTKRTNYWCKFLCFLATLVSIVGIICMTLFYRNSNLVQTQDMMQNNDIAYDPLQTPRATNTAETSGYYKSNGVEDLIDSLPNLLESTCSSSPTNCKFKQYSGYLLANNNREIHYWFIQSEENPHTKPVFIWTNGGPGCSGLLALLTEHGPWRALKNDTIAYNPYSWIREVNMLYLEQPYGVGFSVVDEGQSVVGGDKNAADDMDAAVRDFIAKFPSFARNKFYLSSESWGGHYVPITTDTILRNNDNGATPYIDFAGFLVGNAYTDPYENAYGVVGDIYGHGMLKSSAWNRWREHCWNNVANIDNSTLCEAIYTQAWYNVYHANPYALDYPKCADETHWMKEAHLYRRAMKSMQKVLQSTEKEYDAFNMGHIRKTDLQQVYHEMVDKLRTSAAAQSEKDNGDKVHDAHSYEPCVEEYMSSYLNLEQVQVALHVKPTQWSDCSGSVARAWPDSDFDAFMQPYYANIVHQYVDRLGLTLAIYSGDDDSVCGLEGTMYWLDRCEFDVNPQVIWEQWKDDRDQVGGYYTQYMQQNDNVALHFITIRSAGHMVPTTEPQRALQLLRKYLYTFVDSG